MHKIALPARKLLAISHACILAVNREVYRELSRRGETIELLVPSQLLVNGKWKDAEPSTSADPQIHFRKMIGRHGRLFRFPELVEVLEKSDPSSVIVEADTASLLTLSVANWCKRKNRKLICRTNENLSWRIDEAVARVGWSEIPHAAIKTLLNKLVKPHVQYVCTTSNEATKLFRRLEYNSAVFIPMGTDRKVFHYSSSDRRKARSELGLSATRPVISYFGRLVPEKGVDTLIRALGRIRHLNWTLLLNKFEEATAYSAFINTLINENGIADRVTWAKSTHGLIAKLMTASDVAVLPSLSTPKWVEQYGRVVPEAMACGNLVVVSDSGAPKELIGNSGLVFPEGDHEALANILLKIANNPEECAERRRRAIRHVHRNLSISREAQELIRLLA